MVLVHKKSDNLSDHELICMAQSSSLFLGKKRVFKFENIDPHDVTKHLYFHINILLLVNRKLCENFNINSFVQTNRK